MPGLAGTFTLFWKASSTGMKQAQEMAVLLRQATGEDVPGIVDVHLSSFQHFFLTFLGRRFLELMYREILKEPGNVSLVAVSPGNMVIGFVVGVCNQVGLYRRLAVQRWFGFAAAASRAAIHHPSIIPRLFRALRYPAIASRAMCPALLMSLAVSPHGKGKGVGRSLVENFLMAMAQKGVPEICLDTDRDNNQATNEFYRKLGFAISREFQTPEGRRMYEYSIPTKRT
jgi:ribosomal protein S18 acetylase RimI-like enzyme